MIAARLTFYGTCEEAITFYCETFEGEVIGKSFFWEHADEFPMGLSRTAEKYIYFATLYVPDSKGGSYIDMSDSPVLIFSENREKNGCKDNVIFDVELGLPKDVERIYEIFMQDGAKCNAVIGETEVYEKYASFIDRFGICWNVFCKK